MFPFPVLQRKSTQIPIAPITSSKIRTPRNICHIPGLNPGECSQLRSFLRKTSTRPTQLHCTSGSTLSPGHSLFRVVIPLAQPLLFFAWSQHIQHSPSPLITSPIAYPTSPAVLMAIAVTFLLTQGVLSALSSAEIELLGDETS